jgi:hypothetical protein
MTAIELARHHAFKLACPSVHAYSHVGSIYDIMFDWTVATGSG